MTVTRKSWIPGGDFGSAGTLAAMSAVVKESLTNPAVLDAAHAIVGACPGRDSYCQAQAIRDWLAARFRFVRDPVGVEVLRAPARMIETYWTRGVISGDCDDAAILGAALGKAIALVTCFVAVGFVPGGGLRHVYTVLATPRGWVELDVTRPAGPRPAIARSLSFRV